MNEEDTDVDSRVRKIQDEQTGKAKLALDYTGSDLYDRAGRLAKAKSVKGERHQKKWCLADRRKLKALVAGKQKQDIDWVDVGKQVGRTKDACYVMAVDRRWFLVKNQKHTWKPKTNRAKKSWSKAEDKLLKKLVNGKKTKEVDWAYVSRQLKRTEAGCWTRACYKRFLKINAYNKAVLLQKIIRKPEGDVVQRVEEMLKRVKDIDQQIANLTTMREKIIGRLKLAD
jgi:cyanate lyase